MANKGNSRHISRLASSKYMKLNRKSSAYVAKPRPGRHTVDQAISISTIMREKLGLVRNLREAEMALRAGSVKVNGKAIKEPRFPIGFGDVIEFVPNNQKYKVTVGKGGTFALDDKNTDQMFKVVGKYVAKNKKLMIRLNNGNILEGSKEIKVNDTVELSKNKTSRVIKMESGRKCFVIKGTHASESGTISQINPGNAQKDPIVKIQGSGGEFETLLDNVMVVG